MPQYEYECDSGHRFDELRPVDGRHSVICPACGRHANLRMSAWGRVIFSSFFTVVGGDGRILQRKQITERTPYVDSSGREF